MTDVAALELGPGALAAFDCPIGVSSAYAEMAGLGSFRAALRLFGRGRFERFYEPANCPADITTERPFYPARGVKGTRRDHLRHVLGEAAFAARACDRLAGAGPIFWLVGPRQVGRSAVCVWRELIMPRLDRIALWPFDGPLSELLAAQRPVIAEMYPAFLLRTLGVAVAAQVGARGTGRLRSRAAPPCRRGHAARSRRVRALLRGGFGGSRSGEDPFDATIACIALARLLLDDALPEPPEAARAVEGWILGLPGDRL